jgi:hypothetical protein
MPHRASELADSCEYGNEPPASIKRGISWLPECLLASQEGLCSIELVIYWDTICLSSLQVHFPCSFLKWPVTSYLHQLFLRQQLGELQKPIFRTHFSLLSLLDFISTITIVVRTALGPTQPPNQWVPGALSLGVKRPRREADHSPPSSAEVKNAWSYISTPQYVLMAWYLVKHRENFTFYLTAVVTKAKLEIRMLMRIYWPKRAVVSLT